MTSKRVYLISLGVILSASAYPLYMGAIMLGAYIQNGGINVADYPSYVIPYTPICMALIICTALLPLACKLCKRYALPALSALGVLLFLSAEICFEQITVFANNSTKVSVEIWQLASCIATPEVKASVWDSLSIRYNPSFKIHFYAIALMIVLAVIGVVYGFFKQAHTRDYSSKRALAAQLVSVAAFIGLCLFACFTAFFRTGDINISPLSAILMTLFFLTFGITAGVYVGSWLYARKKLFSIIVPSAAAMLVTIIMYIGEMVMMSWSLFRLGSGFFFDRLGVIPLSLADISTVLLAGIATYFILSAIKPRGDAVI